MPALTSSKLDSQDARLVATLHVLGDKTRFKMFRILLGKEEFCVSEIASNLGISTPAVSQHFKIFEREGLVSRDRYNQKICYCLRKDDPLVKKLIKLIG